MIGAFYQPSMVIIDTLTLNTLPKREINGACEVIKYMVPFRLRILNGAEQHIDELVALHPEEALQHCISRCCQIKADVVARDEMKKAIVHCLILDILLDMPLKLTWVAETGFMVKLFLQR